MRVDTFDIIAPALSAEPWSEAAVLGSATWLWMHSSAHREAPLHSLATLLLPAIKHRQFLLGSEHGKPVFYLSWLNLSAAAEQRYLERSPLELADADWNSGERLWLNDFVSPFGHTTALARLVQRRLFPDRCMRSLDHHGEERGLRVKTHMGLGVIPEQAKAWFAAHPLGLTA